MIRKLSEQSLQVKLNLQSDAVAIESLMTTYAGTPMSLADACLVRLSEQIDCCIITFDSDFEHYRRNKRQTIPLLRPS